MTKWENLYVLVDNNYIHQINGKEIGTLQKGFFAAYKNRPTVSEFLETAGQEGWEVIGLCPANETATWWRIILKRPIQ